MAPDVADAPVVKRRKTEPAAEAVMDFLADAPLPAADTDAPTPAPMLVAAKPGREKARRPKAELVVPADEIDDIFDDA